MAGSGWGAVTSGSAIVFALGADDMMSQVAHDRRPRYSADRQAPQGGGLRRGPGRSPHERAARRARGRAGQLATKADIDRLAADIDRLAADIDRLATANKADLDALDAKIDTKIERLAAEFKAEFALLRSEMEVLRRDVTIRLGGMIVVATGVLLAAKFFG